MEKVKVFNNQKFDVGIVTLERPIGFNIKSGSFAMMSKDDISYVSSISTLFDRGILTVEEDKKLEVEELGIVEEDNPNVVTDAEIKTILNGTLKNLTAWLDKIDEPYILDRVHDISKTMDLKASKLKILQEKMPDREFLPLN